MYSRFAMTWGWVNYDAILVLGGNSYAVKKKKTLLPTNILHLCIYRKGNNLYQRPLDPAGWSVLAHSWDEDWLFSTGMTHQKPCCPKSVSVSCVAPETAVFHCEIKRSCAIQTPSLYPVHPGRFAAECFAQLLLKWGWKRGMHNLTHASFSSLREIYVKSSSLSAINCSVIRWKCKQDLKVSGLGGLTVLICLWMAMLHTTNKMNLTINSEYKNINRLIHFWNFHIFDFKGCQTIEYVGANSLSFSRS